jgi:hypothetical protein
MKLLLTPTLKIAANDKTKAHLYELAAQRITRFTEPQYVSDDMLRGHQDEIEATALYEEHYAPVRQVGFVTNDKWGFTLGYSPDGLVGSDGAIECKSRRQKYQIKTIIENVVEDEGATIPVDYVMQHQTGMMVAELDWIDFVSYSAGLPLVVIRVHPDEVIQNAIIEAAGEAERKIDKMLLAFRDVLRDNRLPIQTERKIEQEMFIG